MNPHSIPRLDGDDDPDTGYFRREDFKTFEHRSSHRAPHDARSDRLTV